MSNSPTPAGHFSEFRGISAAGSDDIWAVGTKGKTISPAPFIEHWNGSRWSVVATPAQRHTQNFPASVSAVTRNSALAVGRYQVRTPSYPLIERWDGDA